MSDTPNQQQLETWIENLEHKSNELISRIRDTTIEQRAIRADLRNQHIRVLTRIEDLEVQLENLRRYRDVT